MVIARFLDRVFGPSGFWTMAPLRYAAKFDPFLSLDCTPTPSTLAQSKERKGSNFAIWQPRNKKKAAAEVKKKKTKPDDKQGPRKIRTPKQEAS